MSSTVLAKKYTDVEIKEGKWVCPDCYSCITIKDLTHKWARMREHIRSKKHQRVVEARSVTSEDELLKQQIVKM